MRTELARSDYEETSRMAVRRQRFLHAAERSKSVRHFDSAICDPPLWARRHLPQTSQAYFSRTATAKRPLGHTSQVQRGRLIDRSNVLSFSLAIKYLERRKRSFSQCLRCWLGLGGMDWGTHEVDTPNRSQVGRRLFHISWSKRVRDEFSGTPRR